jgi:Trpc4-associated protein
MWNRLGGEPTELLIYPRPSPTPPICQTTFDNAVGLAEEVLAVREQTYELSSVTALPQLISGFSARQLAFFCRLLAAMVFEPDDHLEGLPELSGAAVMATSLREADARRADANHHALLRVPTVLHRLVALLRGHATSMTAATPSAAGSGSEPPHHPQVLLLAEDWDEVLSNTGVIDIHAPTQTPATLEALTMAALQAEVLFVLCALLGGTCKVQVQDALAAEEGFVGGLTSMFAGLDWTTRPPPPRGGLSLDDRHGPECACNPDSALKVQLLRLVHNFCDRDRCVRAEWSE